jgi:hypothetical protein
VNTPTPTTDNGPGFLAFVAFFLLALALWFLMRNMNARMRRMSYRQQAAHRGRDEPQAAGDESPADLSPDRVDEGDGRVPDAGADPAEADGPADVRPADDGERPGDLPR